MYTPVDTFPAKSSLRVLPSELLTSIRPAVFDSVSSSGSGSYALALRPALVLSESASSSAAASTFFGVFSVSSVHTSVSLYSSFTTSCSTFSSGSPYSLTSLVFSTASFLFAAFGSYDSSSGFLDPTWIDGFFFSSVVALLPFGVQCDLLHFFSPQVAA